MEQFARCQSGKIMNSELSQINLGRFRNRNVWRSTILRGHESAREDSKNKQQVPETNLLPIVSEVLNLPGKHCRTCVTQTAGNTEHSISDDEQRGNKKPNHRAGHVPWPRTGNQNRQCRCAIHSFDAVIAPSQSSDPSSPAITSGASPRANCLSNRVYPIDRILEGVLLCKIDFLSTKQSNCWRTKKLM